MSKNTKKGTEKNKKVSKSKPANKKASKKVDTKKVDTKETVDEKKVEVKATEPIEQPVESTPTESKKEETEVAKEEVEVVKEEATPFEEEKVEKKPRKEKKPRQSLVNVPKSLRLVTQIALLLAFVFTFITMFVPLGDPAYNGNGLLLALFNGGANQNVIFSTILMMTASIIDLVCVIVTVKQQECKSYSSLIALFANIAFILINIKTNVLSGGLIAAAAAGALFSLVVVILNLFPFIVSRKDKKDFRPRLYIIMNTLVYLVVLAILFLPFNILGSVFTDTNVIFLAFLNGINFSNAAFALGAIFTCLIVLYAVKFDKALKCYLLDKEGFDEYSRKLTCLGIAEGAIFFLAVIIVRIVNNYTSADKVAFNTITYIPFALSSLAVVIQSYFMGKNEVINEIIKKIELKDIKVEELTEEEKAALKIRRNSIALIIFETVLVGTLVGSFFLQFLAVNTTDGVINASYTAYDLIMGFKNEAQSFAIVGYLFLVAALANIFLYVFSICALLSGAKSKTTISKVSTITSYASLLVLASASLYYLASVKSTPKILEAYFPDLPLEEYITDLLDRLSISSQLTYPALAVTLVMICMLLLKPITKIEVESAKLADDRIMVGAGDGGHGEDDEGEGGHGSGDEIDKVSLVDDNLITFDNCPTFTEIDGKKAEFDEDYANRKKQLFENPTLPKLVNYVVDYAKNSRLHLFYKKEDIATFLAGLASAKLSILQGMSGTGKTSLPKIFLEAIYGNCEIVEIESSWRDKNELLGYYNEFSRVYSPKKFTRALYKAVLNPSIVTFIVLDEMNLSRIEYYFSDFLSLMENEEDKREIRLLNNQIFNVYGNARHSYTALKDNHTIMIPKNVWFVGTANRDESTFEISDKVYDRAYTMNFDHRAVSPDKFEDPMKQKFLEYNALKKLFDEAPAVNFSVENNEVIKEVEKALRPYNISFGNRIARQIETFVRVYCNCFNKPEDIVDEALETILLSKVVHKLEYKNVRNKDELIHTFKRLKLNRCVEFINKLEEEF
ncbi:MAG: hypothetical protein MJ214_04470 [Bacilli bacterium]|nr:hypothetical protein [Bacilli bacterium]